MPFATGRNTLNNVPTTKEVDWRLPPCLWQGSGHTPFEDAEGLRRMSNILTFVDDFLNDV